MSKVAKPCWVACLVGERAMLQAPPVGGLLADEGHCGAIRGEKVDPASGGGEGSAVLRVGWSAGTFAAPCMQQLRVRTAHHCVGGVHAHTCPGTHCPRTARRPAKSGSQPARFLRCRCSQQIKKDLAFDCPAFFCRGS